METGARPCFSLKKPENIFYAYYEPVGIGKWISMLSVSESELFQYANMTKKALYISALYLALVFGFYFIWLMLLNERETEKDRCVLQIQRILFDAYRRPEYMQNALERVGAMTSADEACYFEIEENKPLGKYCWGAEGCSAGIRMANEEGQLIVSEILNCAKKKLNDIWYADSLRRSGKTATAELMDSLGIQNIMYTVVTNSSDCIRGIMAVFNIRRTSKSIRLLEEAAFAFSMAVKNMKYFRQSERMGRHDGLTGLLNRSCYQEAVKKYCQKKIKNFACIYVDVNGLHALNNQKGHEAGDRMLCCVAETLSEQFGEEHTYRIGGDEFVAFCENECNETVVQKVKDADAIIKRNGYCVSIGTDWCDNNTNVKNMIKTAETRMYEAKHTYYLEKDGVHKKTSAGWDMERVTVDGRDAEAFLAVIAHMYKGVYLVELNTDDLRIIYIPTYFSAILESTGNKYSKAMRKYIADMVSSDNRRQFEAFLDYRNIERQLDAGNVPTLFYKKIDGAYVRLKVYRSPNFTKQHKETIWLFEDVQN